MCGFLEKIWSPLECIGLLATSCALAIITFSVPFIQDVYLVNITGSANTPGSKVHIGPFSAGGSVSGGLKIGVFGYCLNSQESGGITTRSIGGSNSSSSCTKQFIVKFGDIFKQVTFLGSAANGVSDGVAGCLLLHPIAFLFTILAFIASLALIFRSSTSRKVHSLRHFKVFLIWFAAAITLAALIIDIIIVVESKKHVPFSVQWGKFFFPLLAVSTALLMVIGVVASFFKEHREHKGTESSSTDNRLDKGWIRVDSRQ
ncbi:hypothetical protein BD410DRAFT_793922 [Rickenella mellea]|uniref:Pali-domain-containing protein n=1 Tax=Rickenella mellea TaxID=50990 RepID=A0A4Y7PRT6_9AGAM|nr:hypothetical protein BD410DRAFT_793922 [Rickenella mellea]